MPGHNEENFSQSPHTSSRALGASADRKDRNEKAAEIFKEQREQYKIAMGRLAKTPDGQFVFSVICRACGIFTEDEQINPTKLIEDKGKRKIWLSMFRPFIDKSDLFTIENP